MLLGVNIDHCATLRQARYRHLSPNEFPYIEPDLLQLTLLCEKAGADGITAHLREDARHIQAIDIQRLQENISTRLNLEMACTDEMCRFALEIKPKSVCLVPENREEITTEGGLDATRQIDRVRKVTAKMNAAGIETSLFIDPEPRQIEIAAKIDAPCIELHTGAFANNYHIPSTMRAELSKLQIAARLGNELGLKVNAGHGINYINIVEILEIPHLHELNIGHSIMSRAMINGIEEAVQTMRQLMNPSGN
ncbi:MAG: pyridoxine 5'-phosphate synthase [Opitutae bacterium]|nr:pyridoxine 5'-phosphate synthase [Opitutae bacterium]MBT5691770.1 pyridoxine 5'-phosphate synthase [Opitutae bacterium]MBT6463121.1 pyridoxine 5'-phosphate synthase [Opitutae bacterium]MBT6956945.1 pyridoxine 5'-phosphate synthase [Opitutae bacterium]